MKNGEGPGERFSEGITQGILGLANLPAYASVGETGIEVLENLPRELQEGNAGAIASSAGAVGEQMVGGMVNQATSNPFEFSGQMVGEALAGKGLGKLGSAARGTSRLDGPSGTGRGASSGVPDTDLREVDSTSSREVRDSGAGRQGGDTGSRGRPMTDGGNRWSSHGPHLNRLSELGVSDDRIRALLENNVDLAHHADRVEYLMRAKQWRNIEGEDDVAEALGNAEVRRHHPPDYEVKESVYIRMKDGADVDVEHLEIDSVVLDGSGNVIKHGDVKNSYDPDKINKAIDQNMRVQRFIRNRRNQIDRIETDAGERISMDKWTSENIEETFSVGPYGTRPYRDADPDDILDHTYEFPTTKHQTKLIYETFRDARET